MVECKLLRFTLHMFPFIDIVKFGRLLGVRMFDFPQQFEIVEFCRNFLYSGPIFMYYSIYLTESFHA